ncbi:MAG: CRISPR-associated endonuclease Cas1 [Clostridia bacterium]
MINMVLNYGYTIINGMVARSIIKKGLDCRISIFHKSVYNQFALSSDFIEPFRAVVDILVIELLKNNVISNETLFLDKYLKEIILDFIANFKLMINGLFQQLNNAIDEFVD